MKPTFVLSLDTELVWGSLDHTSPEVFAARYPDVRGVISDLLVMLAQYEIAATWAIVGHLLLGSCSGQHGDISCGITGDRLSMPLFYGDDIVELIKSAKPEQEIGSHSFVHHTYDASPVELRADLDEVVKVAHSQGLDLKSFVFPRNIEGGHALLAESGFIAYRGEDPTWYRALPGSARRLGHFADQALALRPPVSVPSEKVEGLWDIPGSMLLLARNGLRRFIPLSARVRKARLGMQRAIKEGAVFHLWFHPFNMAADRRGMFKCLREVLSEAASLRAAGRLEVKTMGQLARELSLSQSQHMP